MRSRPSGVRLSGRLLNCALLASVSLLAACGDSSTTTRTPPVDARPDSSPASAPPVVISNNDNAPPVSSAHGGILSTSPSSPAGPGAQAGRPSGEADRAELDTRELDRKIEKAEAKAKRAGASEGDKRAAAEAYFERGYKYYTAQNPKLYKYALGDFRRVLKYRPDHAEARELIDQIEGIYRQMGRPIPTNGLDQ